MCALRISCLVWSPDSESTTYDDIAHVTLTKSRHVIDCMVDQIRIECGGIEDGWRQLRITNHMVWLCGQLCIRRWTGMGNSVMSEREVGISHWMMHYVEFLGTYLGTLGT